MTTPQAEISLTIVAHEDAHLAIVKQREGWRDAYQKRAAVLRLSKGDFQKLGIKDNARVEVTSVGGSVVVIAKSDASGEAGLGFMPTSLYTNRLAAYDPTSPVPRKHVQARVQPTDRGVTPVSDLKVRGNRA